MAAFGALAAEFPVTVTILGVPAFGAGEALAPFESRKIGQARPFVREFGLKIKNSEALKLLLHGCMIICPESTHFYRIDKMPNSISLNEFILPTQLTLR